MKSKPAAFSCSGCCFADFAGQFEENAWQIGCDADRDRLFSDPITGRTDFKDFPMYRSVKRFCNMYRDIDWATERGGQDNINLYDDEYMVSIARKEIMPLFGVAVFDDLSLDIQEMYKTADSIYQASKNYDLDKVGVRMSYDYNTRNINHTLDIVNKYFIKGLQCKGIDFLPRDDLENDIYIKEYDVFKQLSNAGYFIRMQAGQTISDSFFCDIDKALNDSMEKVLVFEVNGVLAVQSALMINQYLNFKGYQDAEINLKKMAESEGYFKKYE